MRIFHCDHCGHLIAFENIHCVKCGHVLAYLPDANDMGSLDPLGENRWHARPRAGETEGRIYRLCQNYHKEKVCNWAVAEADQNPLCRSCQLTLVIPNLSLPWHRVAWQRLEAAKRRLLYSLMDLGLPLVSKQEDPVQGLAFKFLADFSATGGATVLTGHSDGLITLNVAEADDAEREKRRMQLGEPYRTLLGHFRHEIAHYYWDRLIKDSDRLEAFRQHFGDEREDYMLALQRHYKEAKPADWHKRFVSMYAGAHAWEDWAETWAHYMHMTDTLESAVVCGLTLRPRRPDEPALLPNLVLHGCRPESFDQMVVAWFPLTYVLNHLNRGLGLPDAYPFVLSPTVIDKLRFVHETIAASASAPVNSPPIDWVAAS